MPIVSCPKCLTFWSALAYGLWSFGFSNVPLMLAVSFLASYMAIWLELLEGFIDKLYMKLYGKIITTDGNNTSASDADNGDSAGTVSEL